MPSQFPYSETTIHTAAVAAALPSVAAGDPIQISSAACEKLCRLLKDWSGVSVDPSKEYLIRGRLRGLMIHENISSLDELLRRAETSAGARLREQIVDMMTTHETLFFRDKHPFEALVQQVIPSMLASDSIRPGAKIRIHCAACSSGQEPYSIAMRLFETCDEATLRRIEITASDVSVGTVEGAKRGEYMDHELRRGLTVGQRKQFFESVAGAPGTVDARLVDSIRKMVRFGVVNLAKPISATMSGGKWDIVFCRNVLIYFEEDVRAGVLRNLASNMSPNGYLFLGSSEMLRDPSNSFRTELVGSTAVHRRV